VTIFSIIISYKKIKMKPFLRNLTLIIAMIISGTLLVDAQKGEFGLRFMPTFSSFEMKNSGGGTVKGDVTLGFGLGALLGFNFTNVVGIQGEVMYSSITQKYKELDVEHRVNLRYLNIPLLLSLNTGKTKAVNFNIVGGPQIGISAGSRLSTVGDNNLIAEPVLSVRRGDLGVAYGAGVDFALNAKRTFRFGLGYRGVLGLLDISDNNKSLTTDSYYILDRTNIKTNAAYFGLSLLF
jgi:hypothetical protein